MLVLSFQIVMLVLCFQIVMLVLCFQIAMLGNCFVGVKTSSIGLKPAIELFLWAESFTESILRGYEATSFFHLVTSPVFHFETSSTPTRTFGSLELLLAMWILLASPLTLATTKSNESEYPEMKTLVTTEVPGALRSKLRPLMFPSLPTAIVTGTARSTIYLGLQTVCSLLCSLIERSPVVSPEIIYKDDGGGGGPPLVVG